VFCSRCGHRTAEVDAAFCVACGRPLDQGSSEADAWDPPQPLERRPSRSVLLWVVACALVAAGAVVLVNACREPSQTDSLVRIEPANTPARAPLDARRLRLPRLWTLPRCLLPLRMPSCLGRSLSISSAGEADPRRPDE
jgi:hypothetical protein